MVISFTYIAIIIYACIIIGNLQKADVYKRQAVSGAARRDLLEKRISDELEHIIESRQIYRYTSGDSRITVADGNERYFVSIAAPILSEGDISGCVLFFSGEEEVSMGETEYKPVSYTHLFFPVIPSGLKWN